jgi:hypothetical protein
MNPTITTRAALAALTALLALPLFVHAAEFVTGDQPSVGSGVAINDDLYLFGGNVSMSGDITGDLIAGGGSVLVSGDVTEDIAVGGGNVTILGSVGDDLRVGGGNVVVNGPVGGDVLVGGGQVQLAGGSIGGDVAVGAGTLRLESPVAGDVLVGGGDVYINSSIAGNVRVEAEKVTLGSGASIGGTLTYAAASEVVMEEGATVAGEIVRQERAARGGPTAGKAAGIFTLALLGKLLMTLVGALALGLFFRRFATEMVQRGAARPLLEMGRGLIFLIVTPIVGIILLVTVIGIPLGIIVLLGYALILVATCFLASIVLGSLVDKWVRKPMEYRVTWQNITVGAILYTLLSLVPIVGWLAQFALVLLALGALLQLKWSVAKEWR